MILAPFYRRDRMRGSRVGFLHVTLLVGAIEPQKSQSSLYGLCFSKSLMIPLIFTSRNQVLAKGVESISCVHTGESHFKIFSIPPVQEKI